MVVPLNMTILCGYMMILFARRGLQLHSLVASVDMWIKSLWALESDKFLHAFNKFMLIVFSLYIERYEFFFIELCLDHN